jgi:hypothetical protein
VDGPDIQPPVGCSSNSVRPSPKLPLIVVSSWKGISKFDGEVKAETQADDSHRSIVRQFHFAKARRRSLPSDRNLIW